MELLDLMSKESINLNLQAKSKDELIDEMIELLYESGKLKDKEAFKKDILKREEQGSTGLGFNLAIPHAKSGEVVKPGVAMGILKEGISYNPSEEEPVKLVFMIGVPEDGGDMHVSILANLARRLVDDDFRNKLINSGSVEEALEILGA